jgi:hypothetical protein
MYINVCYERGFYNHPITINKMIIVVNLYIVGILSIK